MTDHELLPPGHLDAIFDFEVGGLYVRGDELGGQLSAVRNEQTVAVELPARDQTELGAERISGWYGRAGDPTAKIFAVQLIRVRVALGEPPDRKVELRDLLAMAEPTARQTVRELMDWARTNDRQPWLAPAHIEPTPSGASWVENADGERSRGIGNERTVMVMLSEKELPSGDLSRALENERHDEPASLLAEARWAVWPTKDPDTKRAVLLAAIALEVKTSETLLAKADQSAQPLVDLLLTREMSVNFLLTKVAKTIFGETLREFDGRLAKATAELYKLRNDIAHRGITPAPDQARDAVKAAEDVFAWLRQVG
jgi:hypothetical protein